MGREGWREDRRARRSRAAMMAAFERLAMERPVSRITVSALASEAGVDRKTFYQHFGSMDGLLEERSRELVDEVLDAVEVARGGGGAAGGESDVEAFFSALAQALGEKVALNRRLLGSMPTEELLRHLERPLSRGIEERGLVPEGLDGQTMRYALSFALGGLLTMYRTWALEGDEASPDAATEVGRAIAARGLAGVVAGA